MSLSEIKIKLKLYNCQPPANIDSVTLPEPPFLDYRPDFQAIKDIAAKHQVYENLLVIGHGGSITSFMAMYGAFKPESSKKVFFLSTVDPDYITALKTALPIADTLVVAISKSGENTTQMEALMQFLDYPLLLITSPGSPLVPVGEKLNATIVDHPAIGGRYSGLTEVALLPAALCGFDIEALSDGAKSVYGKYSSDNEAWQAASVMYQAEQQGYVDVFLPVYSSRLFPLSNLIVQLCHESFGKQGKGQTYIAHEAPESQHHTNQRFFGGRKNIAGFAVSVDQPEHELRTIIPTELQDISYKGKTLAALNSIKLSDALRFELEGVLEDARIKNIPMAHVSIEQLTFYDLGKLIAFWQLYAVYGSVLREVNPFDQPEVENSKQISFAKRLSRPFADI